MRNRQIKSFRVAADIPALTHNTISGGFWGADKACHPTFAAQNGK